MVVVRQRKCLDCGRALKRGKVLRCGRCRAERRREVDARRKQHSRVRTVAPPPAPTRPVESPFRDAEGRPIPPEQLPDLLRDPTQRPPAGTPEWRDLRAALEAYAASLPEDDPVASDLLGLVEYDFPLPPAPPISDPSSEEAESVYYGERVCELSEENLRLTSSIDLRRWVGDPDWRPEDHTRFVREIARRGEAMPPGIA